MSSAELAGGTLFCRPLQLLTARPAAASPPPSPTVRRPPPGLFSPRIGVDGRDCCLSDDKPRARAHPRAAEARPEPSHCQLAAPPLPNPNMYTGAGPAFPASWEGGCLFLLSLRRLCEEASSAIGRPRRGLRGRARLRRRRGISSPYRAKEVAPSFSMRAGRRERNGDLQRAFLKRAVDRCARPDGMSG